MKPERNAPCPCNSGKKYKKCCLDKPQNYQNTTMPSENDISKIEHLHNQQNEWLSKELSLRSPAEIAYDKIVLSAYKDGKSIKESLDIANSQYPSEALQYNFSSIEDIESHYEHLMNYMEINEKLKTIKKKMAIQNKIETGLVSYANSKDFYEMKEYVSDPEIWESTYEEWLEVIDKSEFELRENGFNTTRVDITVEGLQTFCKKKGVKPDAEARSDYITTLNHG